MVEFEITERLGERIQSLRQEQRLTLDELAENSAVSRAMLSKIERKEKNPTVGVVAKIAKALGVSLFDLLGDWDERKSVVHIPADKRMILTDSETGVERQLLSPTFEGRGIEFMYHIIAKGASTGVLPAAKPGVEKYLVIEKGTLKVTLGEDSYELHEGDAFFYEADIAHSYENIGRSECRYYIVVSTSRR